MKYFGTDGMRGVFGEKITLELCERLAKAILTYKPKKIIIGHDTRVSGPQIADALEKVFRANNVEVINIGTTPTAGVSFLTKQLGCDYGIMITASHNPPEHNGLKVFDKKGEKLDGQELEDLDKLLG